jgi:hypothetical protein
MGRAHIKNSSSTSHTIGERNQDEKGTKPEGKEKFLELLCLKIIQKARVALELLSILLITAGSENSIKLHK